jgi:hypothetical protein
MALPSESPLPDLKEKVEEGKAHTKGIWGWKQFDSKIEDAAKTVKDFNSEYQSMFSHNVSPGMSPAAEEIYMNKYMSQPTLLSQVMAKHDKTNIAYKKMGEFMKNSAGKYVAIGACNEYYGPNLIYGVIMGSWETWAGKATFVIDVPYESAKYFLKTDIVDFHNGVVLKVNGAKIIGPAIGLQYIRFKVTGILSLGE